MADINDGGPAFPCEWDYINSNRAAANGMTLRDYFAAKALPGVQAEYARAKDGLAMNLHDYQDIAADSYTLADAMLKARQS